MHARMHACAPEVDLGECRVCVDVVAHVQDVIALNTQRSLNLHVRGSSGQHTTTIAEHGTHSGLRCLHSHQQRQRHRPKLTVVVTCFALPPQ
jgi:hypothetical protein